MKQSQGTKSTAECLAQMEGSRLTPGAVVPFPLGFNTPRQSGLTRGSQELGLVPFNVLFGTECHLNASGLALKSP